MMTCSCRDWSENMDKIINLQVLEAIRTTRGYDGKVFVFCPWCGKRLTVAVIKREEENV